MKRSVFLKAAELLCLGGVLLAALISCATTQTIPVPTSERYARPSFFMLNNEIFYASAYPPDPFYKGDYELIGTITEAFDDYHTPLSNFQSYTIAVGTEIYQKPALPYQAYLLSSKPPYRYRTKEAGRSYLFHENALFVSLESLSDDSAQRKQYTEKFPANPLPALPESAAYIGQTNFVGYDVFPEKELGSNVAQTPSEVYADAENADVLYLRYPKMTEVNIYVRYTPDG